MEKPKFDELAETLVVKLNEGADKLKGIAVETPEYGVCLKNIATTLGALAQFMPRPVPGHGEENIDAPKNQN